MNIPSKDQLIVDLEKSFLEVKDWINQQTDARINEELIPDKWTIAGHVYHLIKSTKAVSKGIKMPKMGMRAMFGKNNREEKSFEAMKEKYRTRVSNAKGKIPNNFEAEKGRIFDKVELLSRFDTELHDLVQAMGKWNEKDMGSYILPHPALGKCTIRELIYFTIFHTDHHLEILKEKYTEKVV